MCPRQSRQQQQLVSAQLLAQKDLYPTYLKATQPPSNLRTHQVIIKFARLAFIYITKKAKIFGDQTY